MITVATEITGGEPPVTKQGDAKPVSALRPFTDNVEFLERKSDEVMLLLERASRLRSGESSGTASRGAGGGTAPRGPISGNPAGDKGAVPDSSPAGIREVTSRLEALRAETRARLRLSDPGDIPFINLLQQFNLDPTSQDVIWLLFFRATSADFGQKLNGSGLSGSHRASGPTMNIGDILAILYPGDFRAQLAARGVFGADEPLLGRHLIRAPYGMHNRFSILELEVVLAGRIIQWISGDRNEYAAELPFVIERPTTTLDQVILPESVIEPVLKLIGRHREYVELRKQLGLDSVIEYGRAVVILEYGPPGTGKTLLARAISHYTGRPLVSLPVRMPQFFMPEMLGGEEREDLGTLFREAQLQGGIVFIDECEDICGKQSHSLKEFLVELEKSEALVIMTTNRPEDLSPAMDRRITLKVPFQVPAPPLRRKIWELLLPKTIQLADDVDLDYLAKSYALAGGYIKNAVQTALNLALHRSIEGSIQLTQADLEEAAQLQERQVAGAATLRKLVTPRLRLADCACSQVEFDRLERVVRTARNYREVLERWGWRKRGGHARSRGFKVLLNGPCYASCVEAAHAVAGELATRMNEVSLHHLISMAGEHGHGGKERDTQIIRIADVFLLSADSGHLLLLLDPRGLLGHNHVWAEDPNIWEFFDALAAFDGTAIVVSHAKKIRLPDWAAVFHEAVQFGTPDVRSRTVYWRRALDGAIPLAADVQPERLAESYKLDFETIQAIVHKACLLKAADDPNGPLDLDAIRRAADSVMRGRSSSGLLFE